MKSIKTVFIALLFGCQPTENCDLKEILFPNPSEDALVFELDDIWVYSDSIKNVICEAGLSPLYLSIDSSYLHYTSEEITNSCLDIISCGPIRRRNRFEVLVNSKNELFVEGEAAPLTDIDSLFRVVYMNPNQNKDYITKPKSNAITLNWNVRASKDTLELVIKELMHGYESSITSLYNTGTKQAACDSISLNLEKIQYNYPFNLQLHFGREFIPGGRVPPPPPPAPPYDWLPDPEHE